jgi:DNA-binding transcriptional ArsR family regulator
MKPFKVIKGPDTFQILADETRRRIIYLLRARAYTVSQIAKELDLTTQAIYHHIRKLKDAGMVEVAREERVGHFIETYYQATAEVFYLEHGEAKDKEAEAKHVKLALDTLKRIGLPVRADDEFAAKVVAHLRRMDELGTQAEWTEKVAALDDVDFVTRQTLVHAAKLLVITDAEFAEFQKADKELRKLLLSRRVESVLPKP